MSAVLLGTVPAGAASPRTTYLVKHGQTLGGIAHEYRTTVRELVAENPRLKTRPLRAGQTIFLPGQGGEKGARPGVAPAPSRWSGKSKHAGSVHLTRVANSEDAIVVVRDRAGRMPKSTAGVLSRLLRAKTGATHAIDGRLIALVGIVSDHFAGRRLEVISGFRPYTKTQHTPHSNHNVGRAIDFRVVGVPNEVVRDFCRSLRNVGVGYYPNSVFVHLDARTESAYWVDYSRAGEAPRYGDGGVDPDEGASDVSDDNPLLGSAPGESAHEDVVKAPLAKSPETPVTAAPAAPTGDATGVATGDAGTAATTPEN